MLRSWGYRYESQTWGLQGPVTPLEVDVLKVRSYHDKGKPYVLYASTSCVREGTAVVLRSWVDFCNSRSPHDASVLCPKVHVTGAARGRSSRPHSTACSKDTPVLTPARVGVVIALQGLARALRWWRPTSMQHHFQKPFRNISSALDQVLGQIRARPKSTKHLCLSARALDRTEVGSPRNGGPSFDHAQCTISVSLNVSPARKDLKLASKGCAFTNHPPHRTCLLRTWGAHFAFSCAVEGRQKGKNIGWSWFLSRMVVGWWGTLFRR
jgi:hypothetical protein